MRAGEVMTAGDEDAEVADGFDRVAPGWDKWTSVSGQRNAPRYFDAASISSGDRVLEIGAGTGDNRFRLRSCLGRKATSWRWTCQ